ncbi:MAG: hypothetical protein KGZ39_03430 [Simkania sp.]|nr:hypothetical protein [Simkania sp.]
MSSSTLPAASNGQPLDVWARVAPYLIPPAAASAAIVPVFYGFIAKSALQVGAPIPKMPIIEVLKGGFKAAPTIGAIVGTQIAVQKAVEKVLAKGSHGDQETASSARILASSMIVGGASAPALAVFNGQTMGRSIVESLKKLTAKQAGAIVVRETSFLFSLRISDPLGRAMKQVGGDNKAVEYGAAFTSGAIGSVIGHPADTALTLWQRNIQIDSFRSLMRGSPVKAVAVGGFAVCYKFIKEKLEEIQKGKK